MTANQKDEPSIHPIKSLPSARFPQVAEVLQRLPTDVRPEGGLDVLFVNPPAPDGAIWIRSQHRVGRRSREGMIWPQVSLAQMAALLTPHYSVEIIDAIATRMTWPQFEALLREKRPRYYVTQVTGPTLQNDMYGTFLARSLGARTIAFGTHVTPMTRETIEPYPSLDFVLRGEPELTLVELIETLESTNRRIGGKWEKLFREADPDWQPAWLIDINGSPSTDHQPSAIRHPPSAIRHQPSAISHQLSTIRGLAWRRNGEIVINPDRPFIKNLDDLPLPRHDLLPLDRYRIPMVKGPYTFVVTSRGCPAGCKFCIKHVNYQYSVRIRSPQNIIQELWLLHDLGIHNIHMYADLFTVNRDQVVGLCNLILEEGLKIRWTCNSRVDFVDEEMLSLMGHSGCWMVSWGIESANEEILRRVRKGYRPERVAQALAWARAAGIKNWGYFIIGLPGETEETIQQTIEFSRSLPLDLALFHIAAPHPGTPFFFEVVDKGWFRPGTRWEEVDMDRSTVLDYPHLRAEELERWARRAFRAWALRPGPMWTYLKMLLGSPSLWRPALEIGLESLGWARG